MFHTYCVCNKWLVNKKTNCVFHSCFHCLSSSSVQEKSQVRPPLALKLVIFLVTGKMCCRLYSILKKMTMDPWCPWFKEKEEGVTTKGIAQEVFLR